MAARPGIGNCRRGKPTAIGIKIALRLAVCLGIILLAALASKSAPPAKWILHYACDLAAASPSQCYGSQDRSKAFHSRLEAIDFAESHEQYKPMSLEHGKDSFACWWGFTAAIEGDESAIQSFYKQVDCDSDENLVARHCFDDGCDIDFQHHEH
jgi:hypothetical protein